MATHSGTSGLPMSAPVSTNREQRRVALVGWSRTAASEINGSGVDRIGEDATHGGLIPAHLPIGRGTLERGSAVWSPLSGSHPLPDSEQRGPSPQRLRLAPNGLRWGRADGADPPGSRRADGSRVAILRLDTSGADLGACVRRSNSVHTLAPAPRIWSRS